MKRNSKSIELNEYEVLVFDGWASPPAYFWICTVKGDSPEEALLRNMRYVKQELADTMGLDEEWSDEGKFRETLYVLRENGLISVRDAKKIRALKSKMREKRSGEI